MGRKKKIENENTPQINEQPKENIKEVQVNSTSSIIYKGNVQIQIKRGDKIISNRTIRNTGGKQMCDFLAYCLYGTLKGNLSPDFIVLLYEDNNSGSNSILSSLRQVRTKSYALNTVNEIVVSYEFLIPYNAILPGSTEATCNKIALTNSESANQFNSSITNIDLIKYSNAYINLSTINKEIPLSELTINDAILIVWEMKIQSN